MERIIFYIIIAIIIFDFVFERILEYLNVSWRSKQIPTELKGIYDDEKYKKQQAYSKTNSKFSVITSTVSFILIIVFLFFDGFALLNNYLSPNIQN